ncbi:hypothetical protein KY289_026133 [Solanum tuberosum]|nr:hypothetical protein KY289_026133 [Solanum tuberosum]
MGKRTRKPTKKVVMAQEAKLKKKDLDIVDAPPADLEVNTTSESDGDNSSMKNLTEEEPSRYKRVQVRSGSTSIQMSGEITKGNINRTVKTTVKGTGLVQQQWEELIQASSSRSKLSWADEVEIANAQNAKPSVWDSFYIAKLSNAGFKLEFVAPEIHGTSSVCEIALEDISTELYY